MNVCCISLYFIKYCFMQIEREATRRSCNGMRASTSPSLYSIRSNSNLQTKYIFSHHLSLCLCVRFKYNSIYLYFIFLASVFEAE